MIWDAVAVQMRISVEDTSIMGCVFGFTTYVFPCFVFRMFEFAFPVDLVFLVDVIDSFLAGGFGALVLAFDLIALLLSFDDWVGLEFEYVGFFFFRFFIIGDSGSSSSKRRGCLFSRLDDLISE